MEWSDLLTGLALYLVLEGILPFLSPDGWRRSVALLAQLPATSIRVVGLASMVFGAGLLIWVRGGT
jgi:hypothetical protein